MIKGRVFLHKDFKFPDGGIADKYFIILNNPKNNDPYLACKTTSKGDRKPNQEGCHHHKNLYVLNPNYDFFPKKTWIQFHTIFEFDAIGLLQLKFKGIVTMIADLRDQTINAIINCIKKSDDVSIYHLELIKK